jgi:uncharacterized protein
VILASELTRPQRRWFTPFAAKAIKSSVSVSLVALLLVFSGCAKQTLSKSQARSVTAEIVSAAQRLTSRKSEITIRPELQPSIIDASQPPIDHIYVTLGDGSQASALRQAVASIAQRHKLALHESASAGVIRFDLNYNGVPTHSIHVIAPLAARAQPATSNSAPRLAIILDDLGNDRAAADAVMGLPFPITVSVLPHLSLSAEVAEEAYRRGDEVLLHLPMQAGDGAKPEPVELRVGMNANQVEQDLAGMLETVPHAVGVNNHQGSLATSDAALMDALMPALRKRGLFFIDSRTTASTVAFEAAERDGVRAASRKVFLDDSLDRAAILAQLDLAARDAIRNGSAIAIGHPRSATLAALAEGLPRVQSRGMQLVFVSEIVQ